MLFSSMKLFGINSIWFSFRNNPPNPCPCSLGQAQIDRRFSRLNSETSYETAQGVICYGPMTTSWIRWGWNFRPLRTQVNTKIFLFFSKQKWFSSDMLLRYFFRRFDYLWCSRWFSTVRSICNFSTISMAKTNCIPVSSIYSYFEQIPSIIILVTDVVHRHFHLDNPIGVPVVFTINFIQQVVVLDINHQLSVRKKRCIIFELLKFSSHWYRWSTC
jgi:hypothetical protein